GQRPVELAERPLRGEAGGALDQVPLQLAAQVPLEAAKLLPGRAVTAGVIVGEVGLRLGAQSERAPDALHIDPQHARAIALTKRLEGIENLGGADCYTLLAEIVGERQQLTAEAAGPPFGDAAVDVHAASPAVAGSSITPTRAATVSRSVRCLTMTLIVSLNVP